MSILSDFISTIAPLARTVIGAETLSIAGGTAIAGTFNEARHSRDYEDGGFERDAMMDFVCETATFEDAYTSTASAYLGKTATARGATWRVASVSRGSQPRLTDRRHGGAMPKRIVICLPAAPHPGPKSGAASLRMRDDNRQRADPSAPRPGRTTTHE